MSLVLSMTNGDNAYQIEFDLSWETRERECEKFEESLEDEAREEWEAEVKGEWLKMIDEETIWEAKRKQKRLVSEGVSLKETQWEKEWGAVRPVGFYKNRQEIFICGNCSKEIKGSLRNGKAKNRNNPTFWGLETKEKILCLACITRHYYKRIGSWRKRGKLKEYLKRGYV